MKGLIACTHRLSYHQIEFKYRIRRVTYKEMYKTYRKITCHMIPLKLVTVLDIQHTPEQILLLLLNRFPTSWVLK